MNILKFVFPICIFLIVASEDLLFGSIATSNDMNNTILYYDDTSNLNNWDMVTKNTSSNSYLSISSDHSICADPTRPCLVINCEQNDICNIKLKNDIKVTNNTLWMQYSLKYLTGITNPNINKINVRLNCHDSTTCCCSEFQSGCSTAPWYRVGLNYDDPYTSYLHKYEPSYPPSNKVINLNHRYYGEMCAHTNLNMKIFIDVFGTVYVGQSVDSTYVRSLFENVKITIQDFYVFIPSTVPVRINPGPDRGIVEVLFDNRWGTISGSIWTTQMDHICQLEGYPSSKDILYSLSYDDLTMSIWGISNIPSIVWMTNVGGKPLEYELEKDECNIDGPTYCFFDGWGQNVQPNENTTDIPYIYCENTPQPSKAPVPAPTTFENEDDCQYSAIYNFARLGYGNYNNNFSTCCDDELMPISPGLASNNNYCSFYVSCARNYNQCYLNDSHMSNLSDHEWYTCNYLSEIESSNTAIEWVAQVQECLQHNIITKLLWSNTSYSCYEIDDFTYQLHYDCFLADYDLSKISICEMNNSTTWNLLLDKFADLDQIIGWRMTKMLVSMITECISNRNAYWIQNKHVYAFTLYLNVTLEKIINKYKDSEYNIMHWADHTVNHFFWDVYDRIYVTGIITNTMSNVVGLDLVIVTNDTSAIDFIKWRACVAIDSWTYNSVIFWRENQNFTYQVLDIRNNSTAPSLCKPTTTTTTSRPDTTRIDESKIEHVFDIHVFICSHAIVLALLFNM